MCKLTPFQPLSVCSQRNYRHMLFVHSVSTRARMLQGHVLYLVKCTCNSQNRFAHSSAEHKASYLLLLKHSLKHAHSLKHSLTHTLFRSLTHSLPHLLAHSHTHILTHTHTHILTHTLFRSLTRSLPHLLAHSHTHSLIYFLTHSLTCKSFVRVYTTCS